MGPINIPNPVQSLNANDLFTNIIGTLLVWAGAVALLFIIIGGFRYIFSMGNEEGADGARKTVLYAILGLIIIFLAFLIVSYVLNNLLNVSPAYRIG